MQTTESWTYLEARPHPWRRQLFLAHRKLLASTVYNDMLENRIEPDQVALKWDLPIEAVREVVRYCEENLELIKTEALREC